MDITKHPDAHHGAVFAKLDIIISILGSEPDYGMTVAPASGLVEPERVGVTKACATREIRMKLLLAGGSEGARRAKTFAAD